MKVGDGNNAPSTDDLLARMERAHRQEGAEPVDGATEGRASEHVDSTQGTTSRPQTQDKLEERLLETAAVALDDGFRSADELRAKVVEVIVEERYRDKLPAAEADRVVRTLEASLGQDPNFRAEVDDMLVHAARRLARGSD